MPLFVGASESYDTDAWEAYNIKKENAKLRLMVWIMRECLADECKHCSEHGFPCDIDHDMQELGIRICDLASDDELGVEAE